MTRDEAIDIWLGTYPSRGAELVEQAGKDVDRFVRLGMLKLDAPKTADQHAIEALRGHALWGINIDLRAATEVLKVLKNHGLTITKT